jgi:hypothetical protein
MQTAASVLTDQFVALLERLPADLDLDRLAEQTGAIRRKRELVDGASLLRIALARGPGGLSLRQTAAWASMMGIADLSNPGVKYRMNQATEFLADGPRGSSRDGRTRFGLGFIHGGRRARLHFENKPNISATRDKGAYRV